MRRFNGKESDPLSKLSYYGYRYYDEQSLAWTQADPLYLFAPDIGMAAPRRMSLYTFSLNNPVRYMDPDGRDTVIIAGEDNPEAGKPVEEMTEEEKEQWAETQEKARKFNERKMKDAEALKADLVKGGLKEEHVWVTTRKDLEKTVSNIEKNGDSVSTAIGLGHGGLPFQSSMNLEGKIGGTETLPELIEATGLVEGGTFIAWGCSTVYKPELDQFSGGRTVAGTTDKTYPAMAGPSMTSYKGRSSSIGNAVPDVGTHIGPSGRDTNRSIKETVRHSVYRVEGANAFRFKK